MTPSETFGPRSMDSEEIRHILECMRRVHGPGYSKNTRVCNLQNRLSMELELALRMEDRNMRVASDPIPLPEDGGYK